jgi:KDO2-lipid IV(A) lauroyltransferase
VSARDRVEYAGYRLGGAFVRRLPLETAQRLATRVAERLFERGGTRARWTLANLHIALPDLSEERRREIGRASYASFALNVVDWLRAEAWSEADLRERIESHGLENLHAALSGGRGALALTLHLGNFEIAASAPPLYGVESSVVARTLRNPLLYRRIVEARGRTGTRVIDRKGAARGMLRALRKGHLVGVLNDQFARRSRGGILAPFFGVRAMTSAGLATIAVRTGAPVIPAYVVRAGPDRFRVQYEAPLEIPRSGDRRRDIEEATALFNAALEAIIRRYPEQWMWGHRRFRRSPDLDHDPYA